jgi:hypothetical protein
MCSDIAERLQTAAIITDAAAAIAPVDDPLFKTSGKVVVEIHPVESTEEFEINGPPIADEAEHAVAIILLAASEKWVDLLFAKVAEIRRLILSDRSLWRPLHRVPIRSETARAETRDGGERPVTRVVLRLTWREATDYSVDDPDLTGITVSLQAPFNRFALTIDLPEEA